MWAPEAWRKRVRAVQRGPGDEAGRHGGWGAQGGGRAADAVSLAVPAAVWSAISWPWPREAPAQPLLVASAVWTRSKPQVDTVNAYFCARPPIMAT